MRAVGPTVREEGDGAPYVWAAAGNAGVAAPTWRYVSCRGDPDDNIKDDPPQTRGTGGECAIFETGRGTREDSRQQQSFRTAT